MDKFILVDNTICYRRGFQIKTYFDLKTYDESIQKDVVETLNDHFTELTVLKNPSKDSLTFLIGGIPYVEQSKIDDEYRVKIHSKPIKEKDLFHLPTLVQEHHYMNIFDDCNIVKAWPEEYYIIKCDTHKGIYLVDKNNHIVSHYNQIFENFNIFEGKHIVVDIDTFREAGYVRDNGLIDLDTIKKIILMKFHVSYIKKLLCKKNLEEKDLLKFMGECHCKVNTTFSSNDGNVIFFIIDNFGDHYEMKVVFDGNTSNFTILKKI